MSARQWPTSEALTTATEAAAVAYFEAHLRGKNFVDQPWEAVDAVSKLRIRELVLPLVDAALKAVGDPRRVAWIEGYIAADNGRNESTNPYGGSL